MKLIIKDEDRRLVTMIVLEPEVVDKQNQIVSKEEIHEAMVNYMTYYQNIGIGHRGVTRETFGLEDGIVEPENEIWKTAYHEEFSIVESYVAPSDYQTEEGEKVLKGSWIITLRVNDGEIWQRVKNKELTGASIGGHCLLVNEN